MEETLSSFLQLNLLTLLNYSDEHCRLIRNTVDLGLFEGQKRKIASALYNHIDQYHEPPKNHLQELFEDILENRENDMARRKARLLNSDLLQIQENKDSINAALTIDRLEKFIRYQEIMRATLEVAQIVEARQISEENIQKAEEIFSKALHKRMQLFDPGTFFGDDLRALSFFEEKEGDIFKTGILPLDELGLGPQRQTLQLFVGLPKQGKTWYLVNLGKEAFQQSHKILHISLEMSEKQISRRYHQALFAIAKRREELTKTKLQLAALDHEEEGIKEGELRRITRTTFQPKYAFNDGDTVYKYLLKRRRRIDKRLNRIVIKSFPTGQLTLRKLASYMDNLESQFGFIPDLLLLDYPQLMEIDSKNQRIEFGHIVRDLRGIAVERNIAVVAPSQSSRRGLSVGGKLPIITMEHIAEDFSQAMTADVILTYNQTREERELGLARIYVAAARDEEGGSTVLISQSYATGQFCSSAVLSNRQAQKVLLDKLGKEEEEEEND